MTDPQPEAPPAEEDPALEEDPAPEAPSLGAFPTPVNGMITDAVAQALLAGVGTSPGLALAAADLMLAQSTSLLMLNAVQQQQQDMALAQATLGLALQRLLDGSAELVAAAEPKPAKPKSAGPKADG